jgi:putative tryptophan/tyrosine transport system substrate-binding protein
VITASAAPRKLIACVTISAALVSTLAPADQPTIPRVGALVSIGSSPLYEAGLRDGLRELGYLEGKNVVIEWRRSAGGDTDRSLADELVRSKSDVIVVNTTAAARAVLEASTTIPVVFISGDPVSTGLADSLARPGRNGTGVSVVSTELYPKRLEYLHWLVPRARRIGFLTNPSNPIAATQLQATRQAALTLGLQLVTLDARNEAELEASLRALRRGKVDSVIVTADVVIRSNKSKVVQAIRKARLPAMFPYREYHSDGILMSYGPNSTEVGHKMAVYVDKILKGAKPAELPIEQLSQYDLVIDLRVARELGIKVPQDLLLRANEVIR